MRAYALMKANVDAVLKARGISREELSKWCRREVSWASKILNDEKRWFPVPYWDRISDFLGLHPYQLMQPGISALTERRRGERRTGKDRRISAMNHQVRESVSALVASLSPADVADVIRWRALSAESRDAARQTLEELERADRRDAASRREPRAAGSRPSRAKATGTRGQDHGQDDETE